MPHQGPLTGVRVVEAGHHLIAPLTALHLADLGADVIKVEAPDGEEFRWAGPPAPNRKDSRFFLATNRNKRSLCVDLRKPEGRELLQRLIARSDVLIQNFTPDVVDRLGLGYEALSAQNPRLVYCGISAFGETGEGRRRRGFDLVVEAETGLLIQRTPDELPFRGPLPMIDTAGPMMLAYGITAALYARERTGRGDRISSSLLDIAIALQAHQFIWFQDHEPPPRLDPPSLVLYRTFQTSDGFIALGVRSERLWLRLCNALGLADRLADPRFQWDNLFANGDVLRPELEARFRTQTTEHWVEVLEPAGIPCGRCRRGDALFSDPQLEANGIRVTRSMGESGTAQIMGLPLKLQNEPGSVRLPPPHLGEHSVAILEELGYAAAAIDALATSGTIKRR